MKSTNAPDFSTSYDDMLKYTNFNDFQKSTIDNRYLTIVNTLENEYLFTAIAFTVLSNFITVGSVLITAFITLDKLDLLTDRAKSSFFWTARAISIIVTISNKWIHSYNIHRKYLVKGGILEKLKSEGWAFLTTSGKYTRFIDKGQDERFRHFSGRVERIIAKGYGAIANIEKNDFATYEHPSPFDRSSPRGNVKDSFDAANGDGYDHFISSQVLPQGTFMQQPTGHYSIPPPPSSSKPMHKPSTTDNIRSRPSDSAIIRQDTPPDEPKPAPKPEETVEEFDVDKPPEN